MCSITAATPAPVTVAALAPLIEHAHEVNTAVAAALASDPTLLASVPDALLESMALELHAAQDAVEAAATVVTGRVDQQIGDVQGLLIGGVCPSTRRWLEVEAGLSPHAAKAMVGRGRDLVTHSTRVADAWLAGDIPAGAVRPLTLGVSEVLRRSQVHDQVAARSKALDTLLPIAADRDVHRLQRAVTKLKFLIDPDGCTEAALHAWERQSLSIVEQGGMLHVSGTLPWIRVPLCRPCSTSGPGASPPSRSALSPTSPPALPPLTRPPTARAGRPTGPAAHRAWAGATSRPVRSPR